MSGDAKFVPASSEPSARDHCSAQAAGVRVTGVIAAGRYARVLSTSSDDGAKVLKVATETTMADFVGRARFAREGRVGLVLRHPHLVQTLRCGDGWILLNEVGDSTSRAPSLLQRVRKAGPLAAAEVESNIATVAQALAYMHARGFVHRDVKPSNILIGSDARSVLIDLGAVGHPVDDDLDGTELIGSPAWMAPEQIREGATQASADVWSLAMVAAFALSGISVYEGTASDVLRQRRAETGSIDALAEQVLSTASAELGGLIVSALSIDGRSRPPARAFARLGSYV